MHLPRIYSFLAAEAKAVYSDNVTSRYFIIITITIDAASLPVGGTGKKKRKNGGGFEVEVEVEVLVVVVMELAQTTLICFRLLELEPDIY